LQGEATSFLNVDLDIASRVSLASLVDALGSRVFVHHVGKVKRKHWARVSRFSYGQTADKLTRELCSLIQALPSGPRKLWTGALSREFNVGVQSGLWPHCHEVRLSAGTVALVARLGGTIAFTTYAPVLTPGETVGTRSRPRAIRPTNDGADASLPRARRRPRRRSSR
jgi:hypothetical protein